MKKHYPYMNKKSLSARSIKLITILFVLVYLAGCSTFPRYTSTPNEIDPSLHVIESTGDGRPVNPITDEPYLSLADFKTKVGKILTNADRVNDQVDSVNKKQTEKRKLLIHVHGGLNGIDGSYERSKEIADYILKKEKGDNWNYPIFIVWPSGGARTYWEHLYNVRRGEQISPVEGTLTFIPVGLLDGAQSLVRSPITWLNQLKIDYKANATDSKWLPAPSDWKHSKDYITAAKA